MPAIETRDGVRIWCERLSASTALLAPPLLLLQGIGSAHTAWSPLLDRLRRGRDVITMDYRGVGGSDDDFPRDWGIADFADDANDVITELGVGAVDVFGFSMGGRVAQEFVASAKTPVRRLVLFSTSVGARSGVPRAPEVWSAMVDEDDDALTAMNFTEQWRDAHPDFHYREFDTVSEGARQRHLAAVRDHDSWDRTSSITIPTMIIHGSDDPITASENALVLSRLIEGSSVRLVPGGRHSTHIEFPEVVDEALAFLDSDLS